MKRWLTVFALSGVCIAQTIEFEKPTPKRSEVELFTDAANVKAGQPDEVELRFRVAPGLHINSHEPKDELLLPTVASFAGTREVSVLGESYPAGETLHLSVGAGEDVNVYTGEFRVRLRVKAAVGSTTLTGALNYQACDAASCFPPRTLPIRIAVTAR